MPSGGLMQLVSYGSEDLYLTGNPQITFFKVVYKRHTNFSYEWIPIYFEPTLSFSTISNTQMSAPIPRQGDLIRDMSLIVDLPAIFSDEEENFKWVDSLGQVIIHYADIIIAGQRINRNYGQWLNIWSEMSISDDNRKGYDEMIGNTPDMFDPNLYRGAFGTTTNATIPKRRLRIPLDFWFNKHPGLALPLIAIQYVEVRIDLEFRPVNEWFTLGTPPTSPAELFNNPSTDPGSNQVALRQSLINGGWGPNTVFWKFVNGTANPGVWSQNTYLDTKYVFLDNSERRLFAAAVSEYLITQVERLAFTGLIGGQNTVDIEFFHPVKEMIWVFQRSDVYMRNQWTNYTTLANNRDLEKYNEILAASETANQLGIVQNIPVDDVILPSGITVGEFKIYITCTDTLKQFVTYPDAFDQIENIFYFGKFIFNGHDRQCQKSIFYYQYQDQYALHGQAPKRSKQIFDFSFAESPEMIQPSGSANFSRYSKPEFQFTIKSRIPINVCINQNTDNEDFNLFFYVRSLNVLRIMNGIAGLVFAN